LADVLAGRLWGWRVFVKGWDMRWGITAMWEKRAGARLGGRVSVRRALVEACEGRMMLAGDGIVGRSLVGAVELGVVPQTAGDFYSGGVNATAILRSDDLSARPVYSFELTESDRVALKNGDYGSSNAVTPLALVSDSDGDGIVDNGEVLGVINDTRNDRLRHVVRDLAAGEYFVVAGLPEVPANQLREFFLDVSVSRLQLHAGPGGSATEAADLGVLKSGFKVFDIYTAADGVAWYSLTVEQPATAKLAVSLPFGAMPAGEVYFDVNGNGLAAQRELLFRISEDSRETPSITFHPGRYFVRVEGQDGGDQVSFDVIDYQRLPTTVNNRATSRLMDAPEIVLDGEGEALLAGAVMDGGDTGVYFKLVLPEGSFWDLGGGVRLFTDTNQNGLYDGISEDISYWGESNYGYFSLKPGTYGAYVAAVQLGYRTSIRVTRVENFAPTISARKTSDGANYMDVFECRDRNKNLDRVELFRETNGIPGIQNGEGGDEQVETWRSGGYYEFGWEATNGYVAEVPGLQRFYARAVDSFGLASAWIEGIARYPLLSEDLSVVADKVVFRTVNADGTARKLADGEVFDFGEIARGSSGSKELGLVWQSAGAPELRSLRIEGAGFVLLDPIPRMLLGRNEVVAHVQMDSATSGRKAAALIIEWAKAGELGTVTQRLELTGRVTGASAGDVPGGGDIGGGEPPVVDSANVAILGGVKGIKAGTFVAGRALGKASVKVGLPQGGTVARDVAVSYYLSADEVWDGNDVLVGSTTTNLKLNGKKTKTVSTALTAPVLDGDGQAIVGGSYRVMAVVDSGLAMTEANEADNVGMVPAAVTIVPQRVGLSGVVLGGGKIVARKDEKIKVRIKNTGNIDLDSGVVMRFFASQDMVLDEPGDPNILTQTAAVKLKRGASRVISFVQQKNYSSLEGNRFLFGKVDGSLMGVGLAGPVVFAPLKPTLFVPPPPSTGGGRTGADLTTGGSGATDLGLTEFNGVPWI
jgi:hypothetical protein